MARRVRIGSAILAGIAREPAVPSGFVAIYLDRLTRRVVARLSDGTTRQLDAAASSSSGLTHPQVIARIFLGI